MKDGLAHLESKSPLGLTPVSKIAREYLHADFLYLNEFSHLLVIVDNATRKVFLKHCKVENAEVMALALMEFAGNFQVLPKFIVYTDNASYFAGKLMKELSKYLGFSQNFSVQFAPWSNGLVESANRKILRVVRSLVSEFRIYEEDLNKLTGLVMNVMNNSPSVSRAGFTPNELFMAAPGYDPNSLIGRSDFRAPCHGSLQRADDLSVVQEKIFEMRNLISSRLEIAYECSKVTRIRQLRRLNLGAKILQFEIGEYVQLAKDPKSKRHKTKPVWIKPFIVIEALRNNVYIIEDLNGKRKTVHATFLWPFAPRGYEPTEAMRKQFINDRGFLEVEKFLGLEYSSGEYYLLTRWLGFGPEDDTLQPLKIMAQDLPELTLNYLFSLNSRHGRLALVIAKREIDNKGKQQTNIE